MKIKRIEASKYVQERVLVYPEEGDPLRITRAELLQFGLHQGMDLPPELVVELEESGKRSSLRAKGAQLASGRMLSKKELREKLVRKGAEEEEAQGIALWLEELGAVNDESYAAAIVRHYGRMGYGKLRIRQELQRRGIDRNLWDEALEQLPCSGEIIESLLHSRLKGRTPDADEGRKLSAMLQRRGFTWQEIRPVLGRFLDGETLPDE